MDRKDLKHDVFAEEVGHTVQVLREHQSQVKLYGGVAAAVLALGFAYYFYSSSQQSARQAALADAIKVDDATVGSNKQPPLLNFASEDEKIKARVKAYTEVAAKFGGTQEGTIAKMTLASINSDQGKLPEAEKLYKEAADEAPSDYVPVAKIALSNVYVAQGKVADAEKLLKEVVDNPTSLVSKEEATIHLAEVIGLNRPADARKMLEPLRTARSTVSRYAIAALGRLPEAK